MFQDFLPWKWSPPEVISNYIFSIQSDVWSFGVVIWEIFTLGRDPYAGVSFSRNFADELYGGFHRLRKPELASIHLYSLMKRCWYSEPARRVGFTELKERLEQFSAQSPNLWPVTVDGDDDDDVDVEEGGVDGSWVQLQRQTTTTNVETNEIKTQL